MKKENDLTKDLGIVDEKKTTQIVDDVKKEQNTVINEVKEEVKEVKKKIVEVSDALQMFELINAVKPVRTLRIPLISQGIMLTSEVMTLSDIHNVVKSDKYRVRIFEKCFDNLDTESKKIFDNSLKIFKETVSYYDMDMFLSKHIDSWGEEEFENECTKESCSEIIKYKKPLSEMLEIGDTLKERLKEIDNGTAKGVFRPQEPVFKIDDTLSIIFALPSLSRFELVSNMEIPEILIPAILHGESILIDLPNNPEIYEININVDTIKDIISILETKRVNKLNESIGDIFSFLNISYKVKVACPACATINTFTRVDLVDTFIEKVLS